MPVYFIRRQSGEGPIKIGFTDHDPRSRLNNLQCGSPEPIRLLAVIEGDKKYEQQLHRTFRDSRVYGEWFSPTLELLNLIVQNTIPRPTEDSNPEKTRVTTKYEYAIVWLRNRFRDHSEWFSTEIIEAAKQEGLRRDLVFSAKKELGIVTKKDGFGPKARWRWSLPEVA